MTQLAVVLGNTTVRIAWMEGTEVQRSHVFPHHALSDGSAEVALRTEREAGAFHGITRAGICSVVPSLESRVSALLSTLGISEQRRCVPQVASWFPSSYRSMDTLGADRFCAVLAARELHGWPVIVVDGGTATTVNVVDRDGCFLGGSIAPGVHTSFRALHEHTAQLPALDAADVPLLGRDSAECIRSGVLHSARLAIEGAVDELQRIAGYDIPILLTGGNAPVLLAAGLSPARCTHDPDLLLRGVIFCLHYTD